MRRSSWARVACLGAVLAGLAPLSHADGRNPGSVLIFPVHRSGGSYFTIVSVTNLNLEAQTPNSFGGSTLVHYQYRNLEASDDPYDPSGSTVFNRTEFLTPADTLSVMTGCHNATTPGGQEGFLVVDAQDPTQFQVPWSHNYMVGSAFILNASNAMYSVNAIPFLAQASEHQPTDRNRNLYLDFNGIEYEGVPDELYIDSFIAINGSQLALLNLTGTHRDTNVVQLTLWNDNEFPLSAQRPFKSWFDQELPDVSPVFDDDFLRESTPHDPTEVDFNCDGVNNAESGWARIDSIGVYNPMGDLVSPDGALLGVITAGTRTRLDGGHLLWESKERQFNGRAFQP